MNTPEQNISTSPAVLMLVFSVAAARKLVCVTQATSRSCSITERLRSVSRHLDGKKGG